MSERHYTAVDHLIIQADRVFSAFFQDRQQSNTASPADAVEEGLLNEHDRRLSAGFMRVNHAGEVSAQALYHGQALTSHNLETRRNMQKAAQEESDHLAWCRQRLEELGDRTSLLNPVWYLGSLTIGTAAGFVGDKWSLGFVAETERQVVRHLQDHLQRLPANDHKSRAVLLQMVQDEAAHGEAAMAIGGAELPGPVKFAMRICSRVMTRTAYWI